MSRQAVKVEDLWPGDIILFHDEDHQPKRVHNIDSINGALADTLLTLSIEGEINEFHFIYSGNEVFLVQRN